MPPLRRLIALAALCAMLPRGLAAQADQIAAGVAASESHDFAAARKHFEIALQRDSASYEANWRLALLLIDLAKQTPDRVKSPARDSLYVEAETYARRAVAARNDDAQGHFALANAIGRGSLSMSARAKVRRALEVRSEARRAIELDPRHDGAWHILGRWNAEVERLSSLERFFARTFLGAAAFSDASWDEAERDLRLAVQYAPTRILHRLDLAEILVSRRKWNDAKVQLDVLAGLPPVDVLDPLYQRQGAALAAKVREQLHR